MSNKQKLSILQIVPVEGVSKKTGAPFKLYEAHCMLEKSSDQGTTIRVGTLVLSDEQVEHIGDRVPGDWIVDFELQPGFGMEKGRLVPRIISMVPYGVPKAKAAAAGVTA
ncbi:cellulose synthase [Burkholderia cenocepacia]|nr:cellulose synthase [Burkholderia cenocepacia]